MVKAAKNPAAQIATGNGLRDGAVIFLATNGTWSTNVDHSDVAYDGESAARLLATATQAEKDRLVVAPYLIEVGVRDSRVQPVSYRERIRAFGPSTDPQPAERLNVL